MMQRSGFHLRKELNEEVEPSKMLQAEQEERTKIEYQSAKGLAMERKKRRVPRQSRGGAMGWGLEFKNQMIGRIVCFLFEKAYTLCLCLCLCHTHTISP